MRGVKARLVLKYIDPIWHWSTSLLYNLPKPYPNHNPTDSTTLHVYPTDSIPTNPNRNLVLTPRIEDFTSLSSSRLCTEPRPSGTTHPNFTGLSRHVTCRRGSAPLRRHCNTLCTSGFVDDVVHHSKQNPYYPRQAGGIRCVGTVNGGVCDFLALYYVCLSACPRCK